MTFEITTQYNTNPKAVISIHYTHVHMHCTVRVHVYFTFCHCWFMYVHVQYVSVHVHMYVYVPTEKSESVSDRSEESYSFQENIRKSMFTQPNYLLPGSLTVHLQCTLYMFVHVYMHVHNGVLKWT